jgi:cytochrome c oxidase cbb3-type subunit 3
MKLWLRVGLAAILTATLAIAAALGSPSKTDEAASDLFKAKCSMCHGPEGKGFSAIKTPDFTDPKWQEKITDAQILDTIKNGKKDTMMKGFGDKLKEDEIETLAKHIRTFNSKRK